MNGCVVSDEWYELIIEWESLNYFDNIIPVNTVGIFGIAEWNDIPSLRDWYEWTGKIQWG